VLSSKYKIFRLDLPKLVDYDYMNQIICKLNVKKTLSEDCFMKFRENVSLINYIEFLFVTSI
jgi:hypothetical protein